MIVRVTELDHGLLRFIVGANSEFDLTLRGLVGVGYRNLWGTARGINTHLELRYALNRQFLEHSAGVSYYEPVCF